jgi:glycosyltransferase involved in cell wall biosynthesis
LRKDPENVPLKIALSLDEMSIGGGSTFALNLGRELKRAGHQVVIVMHRQGVWWEEVAASGLQAYCLQKSIKSVVGQSKKLAEYWNDQKFDLIILNLCGDNRVAQFSLHYLADKPPVLAVLHGDWPSLYALAHKHKDIWNCAVGVSPKVHADAQLNFPEKPILGILNGVEISVEENIALHQGQTIPLRLLYVGRLTDVHKGILRLPLIVAGCMERHIPVHLTVIGDGEDRAKLICAFSAAGVAAHVSLLGSQVPGSIATAMRQHHILLLPTNMEGMPLVVLEAQANGCVVIATRLRGITDVAIDNNVSGFLVEPGSIDGFVDSISALQEHNRWRQCSIAAKNRAQRLFSLAVMGQHYADVAQCLAQGDYPLKWPSSSGKRATVPYSLLDYLPYQIRTILRRIRRMIVY